MEVFFSIFVAIMQNDIQHVININEKKSILIPVEGKYHKRKVQKTSFTNVYVYCVILLLFTSFRESPICRSLPFFLYIWCLKYNTQIWDRWTLGQLSSTLRSVSCLISMIFYFYYFCWVRKIGLYTHRKKTTRDSPSVFI